MTNKTKISLCQIIETIKVRTELNLQFLIESNNNQLSHQVLKAIESKETFFALIIKPEAISEDILNEFKRLFELYKPLGLEYLKKYTSRFYQYITFEIEMKNKLANLEEHSKEYNHILDINKNYREFLIFNVVTKINDIANSPKKLQNQRILLRKCLSLIVILELDIMDNPVFQEAIFNKKDTLKNFLSNTSLL